MFCVLIPVASVLGRVLCVMCDVCCVLCVVLCVRSLVICVFCVVLSVRCQVSCVVCVVSCVLCLVSCVFCVLCLVSCILYLLSGVMCVVTFVLCLVSCVICTSLVGYFPLCHSIIMTSDHCTCIRSEICPPCIRSYTKETHVAPASATSTGRYMSKNCARVSFLRRKALLAQSTLTDMAPRNSSCPAIMRPSIIICKYFSVEMKTAKLCSQESRTTKYILAPSPLTFTTITWKISTTSWTSYLRLKKSLRTKEKGRKTHTKTVTRTLTLILTL